MANSIFLFDNQADDGVVVASSTAGGTTPASNVQNPQRSAVWRSGAGTTSQLNELFGNSNSVAGMIEI